MKLKREIISGMTVSVTLHVIVLFSLSLIVFHSPLRDLQMVLDSVFNEERMQEEITQDVEESTIAAETVNYVTGAVAAGVGGGGGGGDGGLMVAQQKVGEAESLKTPDIKVNIGSMNMPGLQVISKDLGTGQVTGDVGRVVEGYGGALGQMTQELLRLMRDSRVHVVWLFDESESMKDDQKEIRERFYKVYEELGLVQRHEGKTKVSDETLLTTVMSFGKSVSEHTSKPTSNPDDIKKAIDDIKVDESGLENMCAAIMTATRKYAQMASRQKRKLVLILVTDESGDDGEHVEDAIQVCRSTDTPVYVLGHYSVFGYPYARMRWVDPQFGLEHWLQINRGPETPFAECLQFDGLHSRWDVFSSGFGPYEQVRIAKQTGGIFFMLPGHEDNLVGAGSIEARKFELLNMKEYLPDLSSRLEYVKDRETSKFRTAQWEVVSHLNPFSKDQKEIVPGLKLAQVLNMQEHQYSLEPEEFAKQGKATFDRALVAMALLNDAVQILDSVKKLRDKEQSERWRANYDLMHAQCLAYRVRLFQLLLSLDSHQKAKPRPKNPKNTHWDIHRVHELLEPDKEQVRQTKVNMEELKKQNELAKSEFQSVITNHADTPWARRAQWELAHGFGMKFVESFWDPRYRQVTVKAPTP